MTSARVYAKGIGDAVADRTINRKISPKTRLELPAWTEAGPDTRPFVRETWEDVAYRVALGNSQLPAMIDPSRLNGFDKSEFDALHHHLRQASVLMSGRHLQHTDANIWRRNQEVLTNCSTSASTMILFYLLLNGSGVGRSYDDDMMIVDWRKAPKVTVCIRPDHPDVLSGEISDPHGVQHEGPHAAVHVFEVPDSREGWAKALEQLEFLTWEGTHRDDLLILDFSAVRERGKPIAGMQNRPASGPAPMMNALVRIAALRNAEMQPWKATMYADHYVAECVLVGGARRAARMATKTWRDKSVIEFINVKKGGVLWSSNNSVTVDEEFWKLVRATHGDLKNESLSTRMLAKHAKDVFDAVCKASYHDRTGEPGLINVDQLAQNNDGIEALLDGNYAQSDRFILDRRTLRMTGALAKVFASKTHNMIVNPCVTADTWIQTGEGPRQVSELVGRPHVSIVDGKPYRATGFWETGEKKVFRVKTTRGYEVRATEDHKFLVETCRRQRLGGGYHVDQDWLQLRELEPGDKLVLNNLRDNFDVGEWDEREFDLGWVLGEVVGDGGNNPKKYPSYVRFWGDSAQAMATRASAIVGNAARYNEGNKTHEVRGKFITELCSGLITENKTLLPALEKQGTAFVRGFLRGLFDADGSVQGDLDKGVSVRLWQADERRIKTIQRMLHRLGVASTIYFCREDLDERELPDGKGGRRLCLCSAGHELVISKDNIHQFAAYVGFYEPAKAARLEQVLAGRTRAPYRERFTAEVLEIIEEGVEAVYDCTVDQVHRFDANGIIVHNCGEIPLSMLGGYCVIADVVPFHSRPEYPISTELAVGSVRFNRMWDDDAEDAFRAATRALLRVNMMDCLYGKEVRRTNRIGVGFTGIFEYAWSRFGLGFRDLLDEHGAGAPFWKMMSRFSWAVRDEAEAYSAQLGQSEPHTVTTVKPAGTTSKLFGLTEGAHLPSMREYLRWVQFRNDDPLIEDYRAKGYPVRRLQTYSGTTIVGFPTVPTICTLGMGDKLVTAAEATPEEQYQWLRLLEKYWLHGYEAIAGVGIFVHEQGGQISYTLKYDPAKVSFEEFKRTLLENQAGIKACSVMPQVDTSAYEYQPEEPVSAERFREIVRNISAGAPQEEVGLEHVDCSTGACPIDFLGSER